MTLVPPVKVWLATTPTDFAAVVRLKIKLLKLYPEAFTASPEKVSFAENDSVAFLAQGAKDTEPAGLAIVDHFLDNPRLAHVATIDLIGVLPERAGQGLGEKLMKEVLDFARRQKITRLDLWVMADQERAVKFYEKFGFTREAIAARSAQRPDGTFQDAVLMVLGKEHP